MPLFVFFPFLFVPHIFGFGLLMYFLPTIIAFARSKRDVGAIFVLNFFLGWSVIGWVIALVWALKHDMPMTVR
jgi:Superinfection immunity protein